MQKASGNGHRALGQYAVVAKHAVQQRSSRSPVAVDERVYGFELRMDNGGFCQGVYGILLRKAAEICQAVGHSLGYGRHEECPMGAIDSTTHPHLLLAKLSCEVGAALPEKGAMDVTHAFGCEGAVQAEGAAHSRDVACDDLGVFWR